MVIEAPIGRHPRDRQRMAVAGWVRGSGGPDGAGAFDSSLNPAGPSIRNTGLPMPGRPAKSVVDTLAWDGKLSVVQVKIETGRTHQIRVHLEHRRTPVLGDELYGNTQWNSRVRQKWGIDRPMLHAYRVELRHPISGEPLSFEAPVPGDMMTVVKGISGSDSVPDGVR